MNNETKNCTFRTQETEGRCLLNKNISLTKRRKKNSLDGKGQTWAVADNNKESPNDRQNFVKGMCGGFETRSTYSNVSRFIIKGLRLL